MTHLRKPGHADQAGWDAGRNLQILPVTKRTTFYLIAGAGLTVSTDDENCAVVQAGDSDDARAHKDSELSAWEASQVIRRLTVVGKSTGSTLLRARLDGRDYIAPLTVLVTTNPDARQVGKSCGEVTSELRAELQSLPLRDAVMRVAEDQMHSAVSGTSGFGVYNMTSDLDWCGGFAFWCWEQACTIKGEPNPFGGSNKVLWSPQRALHWAIQESTPGQILRWAGSSPMDGKGKQEYREIGWNNYALQPADIVLLRKQSAGGWKHVCMVHSTTGQTVETIDGNQGAPRSIKIVQRSLDSKTPDGACELVFIAVKR